MTRSGYPTVVRLLLAILVGFVIGAAITGAAITVTASQNPARSEYTSFVAITEHASPDFSGINFFELTFSGRAGGRAVISADGDLNITKWLHAHRDESVMLSFQASDALTRKGLR